MKRLFLIILLLMCLTGCEESTEYVQVDYDITFNLVSDPQTNIIYIRNSTYGDGNPVYTPYYSKNGKLCRYVDGRIKEVEQ